LISIFFNTFHFFLFYSVIMRFYIQIEGLLSFTITWLMKWLIFVRLVQSNIAYNL
jgi:hypothetical protein